MQKGRGAALLSDFKFEDTSAYFTFYELVTGPARSCVISTPGEHTAMLSFRHFDFNVHIIISILQCIYSHLSKVKHGGVECLAQGHNSETTCR